jgi:hypothetical protein
VSRTWDRYMFIAAIAAALAELARVIAGSMDRTMQIAWPIVTIAWIALAWRYHESLSRRSK